MKSYGRTSVSEFLGDFIVYRNLVPFDERLPGLDMVREAAGVAAGTIPRKSETAYARVIAYLLQRAQALWAPGTPLKRLVYVGDTRLNDGGAFANLCGAGGWPGAAFIAAERDEAPCVDVVEQEGGVLYLANRWQALGEFEHFCRERGIEIGAGTAVVVDLDKTALAARGRNDRVIDRARVEAVRRTVGDLLGTGFDGTAFQAAYDRLNQPEFHHFTADNQDYLAYVCLILGSGILTLEPLVDDVRAGRMEGFRQFIAAVDARAAELPTGLRPIHAGIHAAVQQGDPTPFKAFRYNEYRATVARMGNQDDETPVEQLLAEEIVITQEVRSAALAWRARGTLVFGLSDKPDEASLPPAEMAAQGWKAIHRMETHAVGEGNPESGNR
jgi:hypothetical protein